MFDLQKFLRKQVGDETFECALLDVSKKIPDSQREFLVTNGLGSYASGGIWGENSRKYHGLFVAALMPPVDRVVMLSRVDETVTVNGATVELATNLWRNAVAPEGYKKIEGFTPNPCPTWDFNVAAGHLVKQVALVPGKQQAVIGYTWLPSDGSTKAHVKVALLANYRNFHTETRGAADWQFKQEVNDGTVAVKAFDTAKEMVLRFDHGSYSPDPSWYANYFWPRENERGLNDGEDNFRLGFINADLDAGQSLSIVVELSGETSRVDKSLATIGDAVKRTWTHQKELLKRAGNPKDAHQRALVLGADQLLVHRDSTDGSTIMAGYHWFNDWGRDSMISLSGLAIATGRFEAARSVLRTFGKYLSEGMLPNNFPDSAETPHYNTSDATLWWAWALHQYFKATGDMEFVVEQLPKLDEVVAWHKKGTRHGIRLDPADGLVTGGEPGVQLTWMDAKVGDYVVTPRQGKAVEICALWYNFLNVLVELYTAAAKAGALADPEEGKRKAAEYQSMADVTKKGMAKFWNADKGCLFDVITSDGTGDASVRPNQLIALSLPYVAICSDHARSVMAVVDKELLTPYGLRTLSPSDAAYKGQYGNGKAQANQYDRDVTYHQGTVWPWLFGPWVDAHLHAAGDETADVDALLKQLEPICAHVLNDAGIGSISEIFDGDAPYKSRGCVAQAWSVAEVLRVRKRLLELRGAKAPQPVASAKA